MPCEEERTLGRDIEKKDLGLYMPFACWEDPYVENWTGLCLYRADVGMKNGISVEVSLSFLIDNSLC